MSVLKGITITLIDKRPTTKDAFGKTVYRDEEIAIHNVLVAPSLSSDPDVISQYNLTGRKAVYTLAIPKGDTHDWENKEVRFFGERWKTIGIPSQGIDHLIPLSWNKKVLVERYGN